MRWSRRRKLRGTVRVDFSGSVTLVLGSLWSDRLRYALIWERNEVHVLQMVMSIWVVSSHTSSPRRGPIFCNKTSPKVANIHQSGSGFICRIFRVTCLCREIPAICMYPNLHYHENSSCRSAVSLQTLSSPLLGVLLNELRKHLRHYGVGQWGSCQGTKVLIIWTLLSNSPLYLIFNALYSTLTNCKNEDRCIRNVLRNLSLENS